MLFRNRKLYTHGQNSSLFIMQIPKVVCETMGLTKDTLVTVDFDESKGSFTVTKQEPQEEIVDQGQEE